MWPIPEFFKRYFSFSLYQLQKLEQGFPTDFYLSGSNNVISLRATASFGFLFSLTPTLNLTLITVSRCNGDPDLRPPTNTIYCPSATLVYRDLLGVLMSYCPKEDLLWLSRSATITQQHYDFASFHSLEWPHSAPPTAANQRDLLPKRYFGKQRPLGLSDGLLPTTRWALVHELWAAKVGQLWCTYIYRYTYTIIYVATLLNSIKTQTCRCGPQRVKVPHALILWRGGSKSKVIWHLCRSNYLVGAVLWMKMAMAAASISITNTTYKI